jgi:hypothetical protein
MVAGDAIVEGGAVSPYQHIGARCSGGLESPVPKRPSERLAHPDYRRAYRPRMLMFFKWAFGGQDLEGRKPLNLGNDIAGPLRGHRSSFAGEYGSRTLPRGRDRLASPCRLQRCCDLAGRTVSDRAHGVEIQVAVARGRRRLVAADLGQFRECLLDARSGQCDTGLGRGAAGACPRVCGCAGGWEAEFHGSVTFANAAQASATGRRGAVAAVSFGGTFSGSTGDIRFWRIGLCDLVNAKLGAGGQLRSRGS